MKFDHSKDDDHLPYSRSFYADTGERVKWCFAIDSEAGTVSRYATKPGGGMLVKEGRICTIVEHRAVRTEFLMPDGNYAPATEDNFATALTVKVASCANCTWRGPWTKANWQGRFEKGSIVICPQCSAVLPNQHVLDLPLPGSGVETPVPA